MALARITIYYQALPPYKRSHGGNEKLRELAGNLRDYYLSQFQGRVVRGVEVEDRVTAADVTIVALDELNYEPDQARVRVDLELPPSVAGRNESLVVYHRVFLRDWLEQTGNTKVLADEVGNQYIDFTIRFTSIHAGTARAEHAPD